MKIYLNESQYNYIIKHTLGSDLLNESLLNESKIFDVLFRGCKTPQDYVKRLINAAAFGTISLATAIGVFSRINPNASKQDVETFKQEVITATQEKQEKPVDNTVYAKSTNISQSGLEHIRKYERLSLVPYYATAYEKRNKKVTIGWGHVIKNNDPKWLRDIAEAYVTNGKQFKITEQQAEEIFRNDIKIAENFVYKSVISKMDPHLQQANTLPQALIDVMVSMMYNGGYGNFKNTQINPFYNYVLKSRFDKTTGKINMEDYNYIISFIPKSLILQGGKVSNGLVNRRKTEYQIAKNKN